MKFHFVFCATEGLKHFFGHKTKDGIKNKEGRKKRREDGREGRREEGRMEGCGRI